MPLKKKIAVPEYWDIMVDLETLSTRAHAAIISIGAVRFNENQIDEEAAFYRVITIESNLDEHRHISPSTLRWWMQQSEGARAVFNDPAAVALGQALTEFRDWACTPKQWENMRVWGNGADFDCTIIADAYGEQGAPWKFWNTRCFRTLKSSDAARTVPKPANALSHNALADAHAQAKHLQALWAAGIGK